MYSSMVLKGGSCPCTFGPPLLESGGSGLQDPHRITATGLTEVVTICGILTVRDPDSYSNFLSKLKTHYFNIAFLARDSIYAIARYMPSPVRLAVRPSSHPSGHLSVCPSHGWISQRWLKLGSRNLHRVAP